MSCQLPPALRDIKLCLPFGFTIGCRASGFSASSFLKRPRPSLHGPVDDLLSLMPWPNVKQEERNTQTQEEQASAKSGKERSYLSSSSAAV